MDAGIYRYVLSTTLALSGIPNPSVAGVAYKVTVTARDAYGNTATGYRGTIHFTSTDPAAVLPVDHTLTAADVGVHTFSLTLKTIGTQSVTATDTVTASIKGSQSGIVVRSVPGTPRNVTATPANASATVSWAAPSANGGSPITGYTVTSSPGSKICSTTGTLSCTVAGLTNGQAYTFTVKARNAVGTGPASAPSNGVTPRPVPSTYHPITPVRLLDTRMRQRSHRQAHSRPADHVPDNRPNRQEPDDPGRSVRGDGQPHGHGQLGPPGRSIWARTRSPRRLARRSTSPRVRRSPTA